MKGSSISINAIVKETHRITISFHPSKDLQLFFHHSNTFFADYTESIEDVPLSCAIIPFMVNILPIVWITDATIYVETIDRSFYESIEAFKQGYIDMYPMMAFKGHVEVSQVVDNLYATNEEVGILFSGGVDAYATMLLHYNENPLPITVVGADIKLDDEKGIKNMQEHACHALQNLSLRTPCYINSNFRSFLNERELDRLVKKSNDSWWHGFQHGIGIIGLSAPVSYVRKHSVLYIASSHTPKENFTCASHPSIDNRICFGSTITIHDQYENCRQKIIGIITDFHRRTSKLISLRVCWESRGGKNCNHCEKCLRTIYALYAEGEDPTRYGFNYTVQELREASRKFQNNIPFVKERLRVFWIDIQDRFKETQNYAECQDVNWIYSADFNQKPSCRMRLMLQLKRTYWYVKSVIRHFIIRLSPHFFMCDSV